MKQHIIAAMLILAVLTCTVCATDHDVYEGDSIQVAINGAATGDTIYVHAGTYTENVVVNKTLTLLGDGADVVTVRAASSVDHVFEVTVDHVNISGFTVTGATRSYRAGICLNSGADHCNISDNNVSSNDRGIYTHFSEHNTFTNNYASQNNYGFDLAFSRGNNIMRGNTLTDNGCGIHIVGSTSERYNNSIDTSNTVNGKPVYYLYDVHDLVISGVDITHLTIASSTNVTVADSSISGGDGIHLGFVSDSTIIGNTVSDNYRGLFVCGYSYLGQSSEYNIITGNTFSNSMEEGICIDNAGDSIFSDNTISGNSDNGIYLVNHAPNVFTNNTISDNSGNGVHIYTADDGVLTNNIISGNTGDGIYMRGTTNNTVTNNTISNNGVGIFMGGWSGIPTADNRFCSNNITNNTFRGIYANRYANHNLFSGNNVSENGNHGIYLYRSGNDTLIENIVSSNGGNGILLSYLSCNNTLTGNIASANDDGGICLYGTDNSIMTGNVMSGNGYNFDIGGTSLSHFIHDIGESNTVDGEHICYWISQHDRQVPGNAGFVGIIDSTNITVKDMTLTNNGAGILFAYTNNSRIEGVTLSGNYGGIHLRNSNNNDVADNNVSGNSGSGILLAQSNETHLTGNIIISNAGTGIDIWKSGSNTVAGNTVSGNDRGIGVDLSSDNLIYNNYLANTDNAYNDDTGANAWNTTATTGPNIVGGPKIGGNYWSDYTGIDANGDGFGDEPYDNITYSTGMDYLPLVMPMSMCGDIDSDQDIDTVDLMRLMEHVVTGTQVDLCIGDVDGNGHINILDVRLLMLHINDSTEYPLNCGC